MSEVSEAIAQAMQDPLDLRAYLEARYGRPEVPSTSPWQRVEMARLPIMYLKCKRSPIEAKYDGTYQRFKQIVEREGITHYAERGKPHREAFHKKVEGAK